MVDKFSKFIIKNRILVIVLIFVISIISLGGLKNIKFNNKLTDWLSKKDKRLTLFIDISKKFSINNLVLVMVNNEKGVFDSEFLKKIKRFTEKLKEDKRIFLATSITNTSDIRKIQDGIEVKDLIDEIPEEKQKLLHLKSYVLNKEFYKNNIVSSNGKIAAISVFFKEKYNPVESFKDFVLPLSKKIFNNNKVYFSGSPSDTYFVDLYTKKDLVELTPIIIILIFIILYFSFRSFKGVAFPSIVVILSVLWLFGFIGYLGLSLTLISTSIPILLIALGSAYGIHILNKYLNDSMRLNSFGSTELIKSTSEIIVPVLLAGITTLVGFFSFFSAKLSMIADYGIYSAFGILFALFIAITLIPALSSFSKHRMDRKKHEEHKNWLIQIARFNIKYKKAILLFVILLFIISIIGLTHVKREVNFTEYYPENSTPRIGVEISKKSFNGAFPIMFYIKSSNNKSPEVLRIMRRLENYLLSKDGLSIPYSIANFIQDLNFNLNDSYSIPQNLASINNLWFFIDGRDEIKQLITDDFKEGIIFSKLSDNSTKFNLNVYHSINKILNQDINRDYFIYRIDKQSIKNIIDIRKKEAEYLEFEMKSLFKKYKIRDNKLIKNLILNAIKREKFKIKDSEKIIIKNIKSYLESDEFDYELKKQTINNIISDIKNLIDNNELKNKKLKILFNKRLNEFNLEDDELEDLVSTINYKINESINSYRVNTLFKRINSIIKSSNKPFIKRFKSLLFDIFDNIAVLHEPIINQVKGEKLKNFEVKQSGIPSLITVLDSSLFSSQIQSVLIAYFVTLILMVLMRRNFSIGIISTLPILFTISVIYGALGIFGIPLDYATMMIGSISIGVGIDYAIHFIHSFIISYEESRNYEDSIINAFVQRGRAIISNSVAVMIGFAVLLFSSMVLLRNFGGTMVASMFLSAFSTLTILPVLLLLIKPKIRRKK